MDVAIASFVLGLLSTTSPCVLPLYPGFLAYLSGQTELTSPARRSLLGPLVLAGVLTMAVLRHQVSFGLPVSAGVTIYVAASDLIPEVNREPGVGMALVVFLGVGILFLLDRLVHVH